MKRVVRIFAVPERKVFLLGILAIFVTFLFSFCLSLFSAQRSHWFTNWERWDARHYLEIAKHSYQNLGEERVNIAFFPLYPFFIFLFHLLFRNHLFSALFVSNLCFLISLYILYRLLEKDFDKKNSLAGSIIFNCFSHCLFSSCPLYREPFSFFVACLFLFFKKAKVVFSCNFRHACWFMQNNRFFAYSDIFYRVFGCLPL